MNEKTLKQIKHIINTDPNGVMICFTKKDGTLRQMKATTNMALIPEEKHPKKVDETDPNYKPRKVNENIVPIFDVEKMEWRSFDQHTLITIQEKKIEELERELNDKFIIKE